MSINTPFFTIIVTSFNQLDLLKKTLDSVFKQTYRDFELIIADDSSNDGTVKFLKTLKDKRVKLQLNPTNLGIPLNRNMALSNSIGKYVCILDGDDTFNKNYLKQSFEILNKSKSDILISNISLIDEKGDTILNKKFKNNLNPVKYVHRAGFGLMRGCFFKSDLINQFGALNTKFWNFDGYEILLRWSFLDLKWYYNPNPMVNYRVLKNSFSKKMKLITLKNEIFGIWNLYKVELINQISYLSILRNWKLLKFKILIKIYLVGLFK
jgi:glycosyltransferase involved in cell wall biosynthesis